MTESTSGASAPSPSPSGPKRQRISATTLAGLLLVIGGGSYGVWSYTHPNQSAPDAGLVKTEVNDPNAGPSKSLEALVDASIDDRPDPTVPDDSTAQGPNADVGPQPSGVGNQQTSPDPMGRAVKFDPKRINTMRPNRLYIPCLNVYAITQPHGQRYKNGKKTMILNSDPHIITWWKEGGAPGSKKGAVVLAGHVDYMGVWGSLKRLGDIGSGCSAFVSGPDGAIEQFVLTNSKNYIKTDLPSWTNVEPHKLVIVTCGGPFDVSTGHYEDNVVAIFKPVKVWKKGA